MTVPMRWSDDGGEASELERAVLRSDLDASPPDGEKDLVWAKLSSQLGIAGAIGGLAAVEAMSTSAKLKLAAQGGATVADAAVGKVVATAGGTLTFIKGVVVGLLVSGGVWQVQQHFSASTAVPAPAGKMAAVSSAVALRTPAEGTPASAKHEAKPAASFVTETGRGLKRGRSLEPLEMPSQPAATVPSVAAFDDEVRTTDSSEQRVSQLKEEAQVLRQVRSLLRAGNLTSAFAVLESSQRRIRAPELSQERESLMIELLFRSGQTVVAAQRAKQFLAAFPDTPHAARLRELGLP